MWNKTVVVVWVERLKTREGMSRRIKSVVNDRDEEPSLRCRWGECVDCLQVLSVVSVPSPQKPRVGWATIEGYHDGGERKVMFITS